MISANSPFTCRRDFFSSKTRFASFVLPAPVGPVSRIGARELMATCSIRSISALKPALLVSMPGLEERLTLDLLLPKSRRETVVLREVEVDDREGPGPRRASPRPPSPRRSGEVARDARGCDATPSARRGRLGDMRPGRDVDEVVLGVRIEGVALREVEERAVHALEVPGILEVDQVLDHPRLG